MIHPKFRRLVHVLREPAPHVVGYLEVMWHVGYESGNALLGDEVDVELAAQYPGEPGKLFKALLQCGFIDAVEEGQYAIHDLYDHAPDYVQRRLKREIERRERGQERRLAFAPRNRPRTADWRAKAGLAGLSADLAGQQTPNSGLTRRTSELAPPPAPAPAPAPNTPLTPQGGEEDGFAAFWAAYPRKEKKQAALKAWRKLNPDAALVQTLLRALERHKQTDDWQKDGGRFIPQPPAWLNGKRWEDELPAGRPAAAGAPEDYAASAQARRQEEQQQREAVLRNGRKSIKELAQDAPEGR
jgi:hypothetical protein